MTALVLMLVLAAFVTGWTLQQGESASAPEPTPTSAPASPPERTHPRERDRAPAAMPENDVPGEDISGLPRYPGAVRIRHERENLGGLLATEAGYLTPAGLDDARGFYRDAFRANGWSVADVGFSDEAWTFFVVKGEREVFVKLEPHDTLVAVNLELTEPQLREEAAPAPIPDEDEGDDEDDGEYDDDEYDNEYDDD